MLFPISPDIFDRAKFWCISRKEFNLYPPRALLYKITDQKTSAAAKPIPGNEKISRDLVHQMRKKLHNLWTSDSPWKQSEVKSPPGDARNGRNHLPGEMELKPRSLPRRRPSPATMRSLAQTALINEYNGLTLQLGFFVSNGHRFCFHRRIASVSDLMTSEDNYPKS